MPTRTRQFYVPFGDRQLQAVNTFLRDVRKEQIQTVETLPRGRGTDVHILYEDRVLPRITASSPVDGAWVREDEYPSLMTLLFNVPIDESRLNDSTFKWILESSVEAVLASTVVVSESGRRVDVPLPVASLSAYVGSVTLATEGILSVQGVSPPERIQVSLNITDGLLPRGGSSADALVLEDGVLRMNRFVANGVKVGELVDNFIRGSGMSGEQILKTSHIKRGVASEAFVLWYESTYPKVLTITPTPNSTIAKEYDTEKLTLSFSEPVSEYHLRGLDGTDRILFDNTAWDDLPAGTLTQVDDDGTIWTLEATGLFSTEGVHTLVLRDVRNRLGEAHGVLVMYTWTVAPVTATGGGGGGDPRECVRQTYTGDGIETDFELTYAPITDCDMNVFVNGVWCDPTGWSILTGPNRIRFTTPVPAGFTFYLNYYRTV